MDWSTWHSGSRGDGFPGYSIEYRALGVEDAAGLFDLKSMRFNDRSSPCWLPKVLPTREKKPGTTCEGMPSFIAGRFHVVRTKNICPFRMRPVYTGASNGPFQSPFNVSIGAVSASPCSRATRLPLASGRMATILNSCFFRPASWCPFGSYQYFPAIFGFEAFQSYVLFFFSR